MSESSARSRSQRVVRAGQTVRHELLGTTATYVIVEDVFDGVVVEVVEAPGLAPGFRLTLSVTSVASMEVLGASDRQVVGPSAPRAPLGRERFA